MREKGGRNWSQSIAIASDCNPALVLFSLKKAPQFFVSLHRQRGFNSTRQLKRRKTCLLKFKKKGPSNENINRK